LKTSIKDWNSFNNPTDLEFENRIENNLFNFYEDSKYEGWGHSMFCSKFQFASRQSSWKLDDADHQLILERI
jgi:hypothetical protein